MFFLNAYWFQRVKLKIKKKGIVGLLQTTLNFINKNINPKHVGELPFKYLFLKKRKLIKKFTLSQLDILDDINIINIGNYLLNGTYINKNSIVYSFGIGESISFEESLSNKFNCKVFCYDPTSLAVNFMRKKSYNNNLIIFKNYGIWNKDEKVKFFRQNEYDSKGTGGSITNLFKSETYDLLQCYKLKTLLDKNSHNKIDILKLDIEGANLEVLKDIIRDKIYPKQIVAEFEFSEDDKINLEEFNEWSRKLKELIVSFKSLGYKCYNLPRYSHYPYSTIEILFVKQE